MSIFAAVPPSVWAAVRGKDCAFCGSNFQPQRMGQKVCSPTCARRLVKAEKAQAKERAKVERMMDKKRREALRTFPELEEDCRKIVQKIARIRDRNDGCISCDLPANWDGQWHGSHFLSHGSNSAVQFHLWNIHKACWICNKLYSGRINAYEPRLIAKIGQDRVDWLRSQTGIRKHTPEYRAYLMRFKKVMGKRLRRMERSVK